VFTFSIITASYKRLENLKFLYKSIIENKNHLFNIEWVVIVEKEDIDTIKFLKTISQKDIKVKIVNNIHKFQFNQLFKQGVKKASGNYLLILGDDDCIKKNSLIEIFRFIKIKSPKWIIMPATYVDKKFNLIRSIITKVKTFILLLDSKYLLPIINYYMTPGVVVKRNFIQQVDFFPTNVGSSNDWATWLDLLKKEKPLILNKKFCYIGYDNTSISGSYNLNKYFFLIKIIYIRNYFLGLKLISYLVTILVLIINIISKTLERAIKALTIKSKNEKKLNIVKYSNQNILVSVLIGTYNHKNYIFECLNSIKNQTYKNLEIIISDDCSKDETQKVIKNFIKQNRNLNIKFFMQKKNLNISKNFNFLFKKSKGKYIIFFGGDDVMVKEKIELQLKTLIQNPEASFCYSNCGWFNDDMTIKYFNHFNLLQKPPKALRDIFSDFTIPSPTMMISAKFLKKTPMNVNINHLSDFLLAIELFEKSSPVYVNKILVKYRRHNQSVMKNNFDNSERLKLIKILKNKFKKQRNYIDQINLYKNVYLHNEIYVQFNKNRFLFKLILSSFSLFFASPKWFLRNSLLLLNCLLFLTKKKRIYV
jgi:glycosyltransferase involved in cell wall biosynthesis